MPVGLVEPICALPPLSESLRDSQGASSVQHWTVIDRMHGTHWAIGLLYMCSATDGG